MLPPLTRAGMWADRLILPLLAMWSLSIAFTFLDGQNLNRIWSDMEGYYAYLPAVFIYGSFDADSLPLHTTREFLPHPETGRLNLRFTYGVALMQLPFFGATHLITSRGWFHTKNPTGFSPAYSDAIVISALFYVLLGLWLLLRQIRLLARPGVGAATVLLLFGGTNLWFYTIVQAGMSHAYSFCLMAALVALTPRLLTRPTRAGFAWLGGILGLIVLIRPTNLVVALYPLLYGVHSWPDAWARLRWLWQHLPGLGLAALCAFGLFLPQFAYWHHISGSWLYYSYGEAGFTHLLSPRIGSILLSPRNGWWIYSPLILAPLLAVGWETLKRQGQGLAVLLPLLLTLYLCGSWFSWWFGSAFGFRPMIEYYALLALPWAGLLARSWTRGRSAQALMVLLAAAGLYYSLRVGYLYRWYWSHADWTWARLGEVLSTQFWGI